MRHLQKIIHICSIIIITLASSNQTALGAKLQQRLSDVSQHRVIVKDNRSKSVIFKGSGGYFLGQTAASGEPIYERKIAPKELIVKYQNPSALKQPGLDGLNKAVKKISAKTTVLNRSLALAIVKVPTDKSFFTSLAELEKNPAVVYAEPNYIVEAQSVPNDPYYAKQWGLPAIQAEAAWDNVPLSKRANVTIAVLDTGINKTHEDLEGSIVPGYDFINNDTDPEDQQGHGTHVAAIAAGISNNEKGVSGVAGGSKIMPLKVLGDNGSGSYATIIKGIKYAADHGADVINLSLGSAGTSSAMQDAVNYATSHGSSVVAASGNSNSTVMFPANCDDVISVGATDSAGNRAYYSNYGPELDVVAPGSDITSAYINGPSSYVAMSGTSMATPVVSGVVALVRAANPSLTPAGVTEILRKSATDLGNSGFDNYYGYGLVNATRAVQMATSGSTAPTPEPAPKPVPTVPSIQPASNIALNKKVSASSIEGSTRQANYAVDGKSTTRWASREKSDPQWITVDLGKISTLTKLVLKWENAYAKAYQIQLSNDGVNWTTVYATSAGTGGVTTLTGTVRGRFVRLYGTGRGTPYGYSLWEIEVYGQ